jgi:hypothetical protein
VPSEFRAAAGAAVGIKISTLERILSISQAIAGAKYTDFWPKMEAVVTDHSECQSKRLDNLAIRLKVRNTMVLLPDITSVVLKNHSIS